MENKLSCLLFQLPPSILKSEGTAKLKNLFSSSSLNADFYRYAVEFRHKLWFDKEVYMILKKNNVCMTCSQLDAIETSP